MQDDCTLSGRSAIGSYRDTQKRSMQEPQSLRSSAQLRSAPGEALETEGRTGLSVGRSSQKAEKGKRLEGGQR